MHDCINLREQFGDRYRVTYEESYHADLGKGVHRGDPWLQVIECAGGRGHFFPWGGSKLAVSVDRPNVAKKVMRLACCSTVQDGSDGGTCTFDVADFDTVAEIMKPKRRRKLSAEHRARSAKQLKAWRQRNRQGDPEAAPGHAPRGPAKVKSPSSEATAPRSLA